MSDLGKPQSRSGMLCPFFRKAMSKICHRCEMWEPIPVKRVQLGKALESFDRWGCTLKHQTFVLREVVAGLDGVQRATESFRNTAWTDSQKNLEALIEVVAPLERAIAQLPAAAPLLINGKTEQS